MRDSVLRLILMRSVIDYHGYYSPSASEAGTHTFEYSIYPHTGTWQSSNVVELAHSFNQSLQIIPTDQHVGSLPTSHSFIEVVRGNFEITAFKKAENGKGFIIRGYETRGTDEEVQLKLFLPQFQSGEFTDLLERPIRSIHIQGNTMKFQCRPYEFVTLRVHTLERANIERR